MRLRIKKTIDVAWLALLEAGDSGGVYEFLAEEVLGEYEVLLDSYEATPLSVEPGGFLRVQIEGSIPSRDLEWAIQREAIDIDQLLITIGEENYTWEEEDGE